MNEINYYMLKTLGPKHSYWHHIDLLSLRRCVKPVRLQQQPPSDLYVIFSSRHFSRTLAIVIYKRSTDSLKFSNHRATLIPKSFYNLNQLFGNFKFGITVDIIIFLSLHHGQFNEEYLIKFYATISWNTMQISRFIKAVVNLYSVIPGLLL